CMLVLGINLITRSGYISGQMRGRVVTLAREELGFDAGMDSLVFNFFPAYVDMERPYVTGWDKDAPVRAISAESVRVYFSLASLINNELDIRRIRVLAPRVHIVKLSGGGYNIDPLVNRIKELSRKETPGGGLRTEVRQVVVLGAEVTYKDRASGFGLKVANGGADLRLKEGGRLRTSFNIEDITVESAGRRPVHGSFAGDMLYEDGRSEFEALRLAAEGATLKASGAVVWQDTPSLDVSADASLDLGMLDRLGVWKGGPAGRAELTGTVKGTYPNLAGNGKLSLTGVRYAGLEIDDIESSIGFKDGSLEIPGIKSRLLDGTVSGDVYVDLGGQRNGSRPGFRSSWELDGLNSGGYTDGREGVAFIPWHRVSGSFDVSGGFDADSIVAAGHLESRRYERPYPMMAIHPDLAIINEVRLNFMLNDGVIDVRQCNVLTDATTIEAAGTVGLDGMTALTLRGRSGNIGEIANMIGYSRMTGSLETAATVREHILEPEIIGKAYVTGARANGILIDSGAGDVKLSGWVLSFRDFLVTQGKGKFLLNGSIAFKGGEASFENPHFSAKLGIKKGDVRRVVAIFYKDIPVNLVADGEMRFDGFIHEFAGEAELTTGPGDVYGQPLDKGHVKAVLGTNDIKFPKVTAIRGRDIVTGTGGIGFDGTFYGKVSSARIDIENFRLLMDTGVPLKGSVSVSISGDGTFDHPVIKGNVQAYRLFYHSVDLGDGAVTAAIKDKVMTYTGSILDGNVRLDGAMGLGAPYTWRARLTFDEGRFEPFVRLAWKDMPEDVSLVSTGVFSGEGALDDPSRTSLSLDFSKVDADFMGRRLRNDGDISLTYKGGRLGVKSLKLKGDRLNLEASGGAESEERLDLMMKVGADLDLLKEFAEEGVDYVDGKLQADLGVSGSYDNPSLSGRIKVVNAGFKLKGFPQRFDRINGTAVLAGGEVTLSDFTAELGGGKVTASGKAGLNGFSVASYTVAIGADDVRLKYPEELLSTVDAGIILEGAGDRHDISGDLIIRKARYTERVDWKSWLVDFQKKREEISSAEPGPMSDVSLNIHVTADETIRVDNNVAKLPVSADMYVRGSIGRPMVLGRIESSGGLVYFRNNEFKLANLVAEFADPRKINPIIDLQAETRVKEYQIQLGVSGTLDRLRVSLMSDPPLDDGDIVTLLTLGRTSEALVGREAVVGTGEAASFVTGQIQDAVEGRLRRITGFDRFQIDPYLTSSGTSSGPRVTVGKSLLSDKLYITYSSNLGTSEDQFVRMEYIVNKNLSVIAERDELGRVGADLKLRFEFK
ncbi:MAG: translocation/assembly module TamB domain-containing protein, partial [Nitrospirae bacterium]|nr:translocation/assembly module TamB domain-containing protein [Nitrospirota bacterium]